MYNLDKYSLFFNINFFKDISIDIGSFSIKEPSIFIKIVDSRLDMGF